MLGRNQVSFIVVRASSCVEVGWVIGWDKCSFHDRVKWGKSGRWGNNNYVDCGFFGTGSVSMIA